MRVFFSFSGVRGKAAADHLALWLRRIVQSVEPWISSEIGKGERWLYKLNNQLEQNDVGIICLSEDDLKSPWILFEAGALSKSKTAHICTFLLDNDPSDIALPLSQFQATIASKTDIRRLVHTMNDIAHSRGERSLSERDLDELYDQLWPELKAKLKEIPRPAEVLNHPMDHATHGFIESRALVMYQAENLEGKISVPKEDKDASNGLCRYQQVGAKRHHVIYGPYDSLRVLGSYVAFYRMKISEEAPDGPLLYLEVRGGARAGRSLHRASFLAIDSYDTFALPFRAKSTRPMEYRVRPGASLGEIWIDYVAVLHGHDFALAE